MSFPVRLALVAVALAAVQCTTPVDPQPMIAVSSATMTFNATTGGGDPANQSVMIANGGGGTLGDIAANVTYPAGQPGGWLTATLSGATAPATLTLSAALGAMPPSAYTATVSLTATRAGNSPVAVPVTFTVAAGGVTTLSATTANLAAVNGTQPAPSTLINITNGGVGALADLSATVSYPGGTPAFGPWLTATLNTTTAPAQLTLEASTGALPGVHTAAVTLASPYAANGPQTITLTYTVTAAPMIDFDRDTVALEMVFNGSLPNVDVAVTNAGGGTLSQIQFLGIAFSTPPTPVLWVTASVTPATAPATLTLTFEPQFLVPGTHTAWVRVGAVGAINDPDSVLVHILVHPELSMALDSVHFEGAAGTPDPTPYNVFVGATHGGEIGGLNVAIRYAPGEPTGWLTTTLDRDSTPALIELRLTTAGLTAGGLFTAFLDVSSPQAANGPLEVIVTFHVTGAPDLVVTEPAVLTVSPLPLQGGTNVTVPSWTITNQGEGTAGQFDYGVFLSADTVFTTDDIQLMRETTPSVGPGLTRFTSARLLTVPPQTPGGDYWIGLVADVAQQVIETDETNNSKRTAVAVTAAAVVAVDVDSLLFRFTAGGPMPPQRHVTITNGGGGALDQLTWGVIHTPGQPQNWVAGQLHGSSAPAVLDLALHSPTAAQLDAGTYTGEVQITSIGAGVSHVFPLTLIVDAALTVSTASVDFTATQGGAAPPTQTVAVTSVRGPLGGLDVEITYADGEAEGWLSTALSSGSAPADLELTVDQAGLPLGTYTAQVAVIAAAANSPRIVDVQLTVLPVANLQVAPNQLGFQGVAGGANPASQNLTVTGLGGTVTGLAATVAYTPGQPNGWLQLTPSGTSTPAQIRVQPVLGGLDPGSYAATISVQGVAANNPQTVSVILAVLSPLPDLVVAGIGGPFTVTPTSTPQAGTVTLSPFRVTNPGTQPSGDYDLGIYLSTDAVLTTADTRLVGQLLPSLDPGAALDVGAVGIQIPLTFPAGSYFVGVLLDGLDSIAEVNEGNNVVMAAFSVTVAPLPPPSPSNLVATVRSTTRIDLSWTDNATTETRFDIERCAGTLSCFPIGGGTPSFSVIGSVGPNETTFQNFGLSPTSVYYYRVRAVNAAGSSPPSATVTAQPAMPAPTNAAATATSVSQVNVTWTDNALDETGFEIWRCTGATCSTTALVGTVGANITAFGDAGLGEATTYRYQVRAMGPPSSAFSSIATVTTLSATTAPTAPTGLGATVVSGNQIDLAWTDNAINESGYRVERCQNAGCTAFVEVAIVDGSVTAFQNVGLSGSTTYRFRVRAFNSVGTSAFSAIVTATTLVVPNAPSAFVVTAVNSRLIRLTWTDHAANETGFRIERCQGATCTNYVLLTTTATNAVLYNDNSVSRNTTYRYRLAASNANGVSAFLTGEAATPPLEPPTGLVATTNSSGRITLTWTNNAPQVTVSSVEIHRCAGAACTTFALLDDVGPNVATFVNSGLTPQTSYTYRLRAREAAGQSAFSNTATAVTAVAPAAPTGLAATSPLSTAVALTWVDHALSGASLEIERCSGTAGCTNFARITTVSAALEAYTNTGVQTATTHRYRVRTTDGDTPSAYSNIVTVTTQAAAGSPTSPQNLVATVVSSAQIDLVWSNVATNETGYLVERCTGAGCTNFASIVNQSVANVASYQNTGLAAQTTYSYRVRLFNASGNSLYSNIVTATTAALPAPTGLTGTAISPTQINLSWTDNAVNENQFRIERCTGTGAGCTPFVQVGTTGTNVVTFGSTGLTTGTSYAFRVRAANSAGSVSAYSNVVTISTPVAVSAVGAP